MARPLGQERPQRRQLTGPVDVDPQEPRGRDGVLAAAALCAWRDADERLLTRRAVEQLAREGARDDPLGVPEQRLKPAVLAAGAAGQVVLGPAAAVDVELAVGRAHARCELDQLARVGVQHAELQRPVALGRQLAGEHAPVGEPDPTAQARRSGSSRAGWRAAVAGFARRSCCPDRSRRRRCLPRASRSGRPRRVPSERVARSQTVVERVLLGGVVACERFGLRAPVLGIGELLDEHGLRAGDVDDAPSLRGGALDGDEVLVAIPGAIAGGDGVRAWVVSLLLRDCGARCGLGVRPRAGACFDGRRQRQCGRRPGPRARRAQRQGRRSPACQARKSRSARALASRRSSCRLSESSARRNVVAVPEREPRPTGS